MRPKIINLKSNYIDYFSKSGSISMTPEQFEKFKNGEISYNVIDTKTDKSIGIIKFSDVTSYETLYKNVNRSKNIKYSRHQNIKYTKTCNAGACMSIVVCKF